jgi:transposase
MARKGPNIRAFNKQFPDDDSCLEHLMRVRYGERLTCLGCHKQGTPLLRVRALRLSGLSDRRDSL